MEGSLALFFLHKGSETKKPSIHRNIKPSNIYVSKYDGCLKLTNYGMLKEVVIKNPDVNLTRNIVRPGTGEDEKKKAVFSDSLFYMPPEAAYNYVFGNPKIDAGKMMYLRRLDPKDIVDRRIIKDAGKEDIFRIDGYLWVETGDLNYIEAYKDKTGNLLIEGFYDNSGTVSRKRKCYKAFRDNCGNGNVVVMDTKSDIFQIGATLYEMISGGRNPARYAASAFNNPEDYITSMAMALKKGIKPKNRSPKLRDYMLCSDVREVPKAEFGAYFDRFKVKMSEKGREKAEALYCIDEKLMLMCNKRGRFIDENGKKSAKIFSLAGDGYYVRTQKMQKTNEKLLLNIHNTIIDGRMNDSLCEIVDWCLEPDPDDRPTTQQLCEMFYCLRNNIRIKNRKYPAVDEEKMRGYFKESVEKKDIGVFAGIAGKINQDG
jgi:serine/threonine protein kinase